MCNEVNVERATLSIARAHRIGALNQLLVFAFRLLESELYIGAVLIDRESIKPRPSEGDAQHVRSEHAFTEHLDGVNRSFFLLRCQDFVFPFSIASIGFARNDSSSFSPPGQIHAPSVSAPAPQFNIAPSLRFGQRGAYHAHHTIQK